MLKRFVFPETGHFATRMRHRAMAGPGFLQLYFSTLFTQKLSFTQ